MYSTNTYLDKYTFFLFRSSVKETKLLKIHTKYDSLKIS